MALFNKLFFPTASASSTPTLTSVKAASNSRTSSSSTSNGSNNNGKRQSCNQTEHSTNYLSQFPFDGEQVRVLLYRECDSQGRRLLFDSNALQRVPLKETNGNVAKSQSNFTINGVHRKEEEAKKHQQLQNNNNQSNNKKTSNCFVEHNEEFGFKHIRPKTADITSLGEMVFGALAMSFRGTAFKVHWLQEPTRILCSQVFLTPVNSAQHSPYTTHSANSFGTPRHSISSEYGSVDGASVNSFSMPFTVNIERHLSETASERSSSLLTEASPLDVPDHQLLSTNSNHSGSLRVENSRRYSSTCSSGTDSGFSAMSRLGASGTSSSDQWSLTNPQSSTLSSLGSVLSDRSVQQRKLSTDSSNYASSSGVLHSERFSSDSSLQRRISRHIRTSLENDDSLSDFIGFITDSYPQSKAIDYTCSYADNETRSNPEIAKRRDGAVKSLSRRAKLGLAVCISMSESFEEEMELFCSEHIALLESMQDRLRAATERAYINHKDFLQIMFHAWQQTQRWIQDLFTAPRIKCPVWLNITTSGSKYSKNVAERFIKELCWLLSIADTKDTNFFISTMLTAVLTHHLGWVSTVSCLNNTDAFTRSQTTVAALEQRAKLLEVSQKHPYNALWAQMGDLYGAIGMPPKLTRTIVYGTEKLSVERLLNILTYFIRCGEVRRRSAKREDFDKQLLKSFIAQNEQKTAEKKFQTVSSQPNSMRDDDDVCKSRQSSGLKRVQSSVQNLNALSDVQSNSEEGGDAICTLKKNEIPNVFAFRDSHFVQQELRIGNYLMDTGILKSSMRNHSKKRACAEDKILVTVTSPEAVELPIEMGTESVGDGVLEAIEIGSEVVDATKPVPKQSNKKSFLWQIVPSVVKEGLSVQDFEKLQNGVKLINQKMDQRSFSFSQQLEPTNTKQNNNLSLSDLITQNSIGKCDRMTWGIEPMKEVISLKDQIHLDLCRNGQREKRNHGSDVVFVLGDNEPLVNIKRSAEDLETSADKNRINDSKKDTICPLHQQTHAPLSYTKKHHFGVKFNFETYPQIANNYMKNKNLVLSNNEGRFVLGKSKQQQQTTDEHLMFDSFASVNIEKRTSKCSGLHSASPAACVISNTYQTPSNATELEFETDDEHGYEKINHDTLSAGFPTVDSATSVDTLKSCNGWAEESQAVGQELLANLEIAPANSEQCRNVPIPVDSSTSSVATKCAPITEMMRLCMLPVPGTKEVLQDDELLGDMKLKPGFIPSLFLNVNDHYISDMVLQGTFASPRKWEMNLREDLALAAHSASLISQSVENVAIVADMEKWDVRLISSQMQSFPYAGGQSAPVGMSQLVSSMLETVQVMNTAGISAYECLSFLESKLQEIYLQSEALAAFLLDADFCPLSAVTTALNLSENDVPLLLSIATIHTPQISKKCGISFR